MGILYNLRKDYIQNKLNEDNLPENPVQLFQHWFDEIRTNAPDFEANAMALATANKSGIPSNRMVLLKDFSISGFVFFTNYESRKGLEIAENPNAALLFFWHPMERQVRIEGIVEKLPDEESNTYFNSRPRDSKIGAWISPQSRIIPDRNFLEKKFKNKLNEAQENIEKPPFWGGYFLIPKKIEFWQGGKNRLHDRIEYTHTEHTWNIQRLAP